MADEDLRLRLLGIGNLLTWIWRTLVVLLGLCALALWRFW